MLRGLLGFLLALALLTAPLIVVLWLGAGPAVGEHPTRALVVGCAWLVFLGWVYTRVHNGDRNGGTSQLTRR
jgi:hypothetical protein